MIRIGLDWYTQYKTIERRGESAALGHFSVFIFFWESRQ